MSNIIQQLNDVGLPEREAKVYTALLELGDSAVLPIAKKANIQRTYVYDILELLIKKGLVSHTEKNGKSRYAAQDPTAIGALLLNRVSTFTSILPELKALHNAAPAKPKVQFFEGKDEIKAIYEHLTEVESYDCIYSHPHVVAAWGEYSADFGKLIVDKNIRVRELLAAPAPPSYQELYKKGLQEIRLLPENTDISIDFILYENKLALISYEDILHTVIIESPGIISSFRSLFNFMWESSKKERYQINTSR